MVNPILMPYANKIPFWGNSADQNHFVQNQLFVKYLCPLSQCAKRLISALPIGVIYAIYAGSGSNSFFFDALGRVRGVVC